jgi:hypothetical protein
LVMRGGVGPRRWEEVDGAPGVGGAVRERGEVSI